MAEPEPIENSEPDAEPEEEARAPKGAKPGGRPDWLVGAEDALESELERFGGQGSPPELRSAAPPDRARPGPPPVNPYAGFAQSEAARSFGTQWMETGYKGTSPDHPASPAHAANHPSPPEDTREAGEEHAGIAAGDRDEAAAHEADLGEAETARSPATAAPAPARERARRPAPPPPPPPWWEKAFDVVKSPAGLIAIGAAVVLIFVALAIAGAKDPSVSISRIRRDAQQFDGRMVRVHGTVGEVYPVGGGYSFYLLQGRDTLVVYTRSRTPVRDERISVTGVISTGVLNGELRQALLENTK